MTRFAYRSSEVGAEGVPGELSRAVSGAGLGPRFWFRGDLDACRLARVAVIGTRQPGAASTAALEGLAANLAAAGVAVVSGAAQGTDMAAHRGALNAGGATIAVLPRGLATVRRETWRREFAGLTLQARLLLLSVMPPKADMTRQSPIVRNRLVAHLSQCVVVGEAGLNSGTMTCVRFALDRGVPVYFLDERGGDSDAARALRSAGGVPFTLAEALDGAMVRRLRESAAAFEQRQLAADRAQLKLFGEE